MKKSHTILAIAGMAIAMFTPDFANAQRGGNRNNPGNLFGGSNSGRQQDAGQILQNQLQNRIRNEVGNAIGRSSGNNQRFNNQRQNDQLFGQQRNGNNFSRQMFSNRNNQFGNSNRQNRRYQSSPLAALIVSQFPEARRILSPRGTGYGNHNRGAFYRNNDQYYYYPDSYARGNYPQGYQTQPNGVQLSGGANVGRSVVQAGGSAQQQGQPVEVQFGQFAYTDQLSEVLTAVLNDLCLDMHYNYSHNANFSAIYRDAFAALTEAKGLRNAQQSDDRETIKQRLTVTDAILHRLEPQVQGWTRVHQKQVGESGMLTKLEIAGDVTHHMMHDAGISQEEHDQSSTTSATTDPAQSAEQAPAPQ